MIKVAPVAVAMGRLIASQDSYYVEGSMDVRHSDLYQKHSENITLQSVAATIRKPEPYDQAYKRSITRVPPPFSRPQRTLAPKEQLSCPCLSDGTRPITFAKKSVFVVQSCDDQ